MIPSCKSIPSNSGGQPLNSTPQSEAVKDPLVNLFQLSVPYKATSTVNVCEIDIYTQDTFENLILAKIALQWPYFLAVVEDVNHVIQFVDGIAFMRGYFKYGCKNSSTTRSSILDARIYQIDEIVGCTFQNLCTLSELLAHRQHFAKFINACDLTLDPKVRGQERYYMGAVFEKGKKKEDGNILISKNLDRSWFWYMKSAEDGYFGAHLALAAWYEKGNEKVEKSEADYYQHISLAEKTIPEENPTARILHQMMDAAR